MGFAFSKHLCTVFEIKGLVQLTVIPQSGSGRPELELDINNKHKLITFVNMIIYQTISLFVLSIVIGWAYFMPD